MVGEELIKPVVINGAENLLETNATNIMVGMFGVQTVESVKGVSNEFSVYLQNAYEKVSEGFDIGLSRFVSNISAEQFSTALKVGGIGALAGFGLGLALTIYAEKLEKQRTGHEPVPRLGIGCSTIPSAMFYGAVAGFVGGLIFS